MSKFLEKKSDSSYFLHINAKPNSNKQEIIDDGQYLTILLRSKAIQNRANKELINFLRKKLKISSNQVKFVSGLKNSNKIIEISFNEDIEESEVIKKILG